MGLQDSVAANEALAKAISQAITPDEVRELMVRARENSGFVTPSDGGQPRDPNTRQFVSATEPKTFEKTVHLAGKDMTFHGSSEIEVERMIAAAAEVALAVRGDSDAETAEERAERERMERHAGANQAELEMQFRNGQITAAEYLDKSGAVDDVLAARGISTDKLFEQSWADATQEFLNSEVGADWPGGERNKTLVGNILAQLGLVNSTDKVAALQQAYDYMKQNDLLFPNEETSEHKLNQVLEATKRNLDNGHISPQQVLEAWKQGVEQLGLAPDDVFMRANSSTGSGRSDTETNRGSGMFGTR